MKKGFVFGKFLPFHKGHEALIRFGASQCEHLTVLVCCSDREKIPCTQRVAWITATLADTPHVQVKGYHYLERDLPNTSVTSEAVSRVWAAVFERECPGCSLLFTSEPYGALVAEFMGIAHRPFDPARQQVPVSGTAIRRDPFQFWPFLPEAVQKDLVFKVAILGTESTGKTTLTRQLAAHFKGIPVLEAARDLIEDSNHFSLEDLQLVAAEHARRIEEALTGGSPLVILDTDVLITKSYAQFFLEKNLLLPPEILNTNKCNLYLYLTNEVPYVQDGTRLDQTQRDALDAAHRAMLAQHRVAFVEINGDWEQRFIRAVKTIQAEMLLQWNTLLLE